MQNIPEVFRKAGFEPRPCTPVQISPEDKKRLDDITKAVKKHLEDLNRAYKMSKHSKLVFRHRIARHRRPFLVLPSKEIQQTQ